jgi:hypothetical protein
MIALGTSLRARKFLAEHLGVAVSTVDWGNTLFPFGKYKGEKFKDIPPGHLVWICDWIDNDSEKRVKFRTLRRLISNYLGQTDDR